MIEKRKENLNTFNDEVFDAAMKYKEDIDGYDPKLPRYPVSECPKEFYRITLTKPLTKHILTQLNQRFADFQKTASQGLYLIPSVIVKAEESDDLF